MTQERMEKLWSMAISEDEGVRKLCLSILLNDDFKDYSKIRLNYQTLDLDKAEPYQILATELIWNSEKYIMDKFNINYDEQGSQILHRDVYVVTNGDGRLVEDIIGPKFIKK